MKYTLMNKNKVVMLLEYNDDYYFIENIYKIYNILYAPLAIINAYSDKSKNLVKEANDWFRGRGIPS